MAQRKNFPTGPCLDGGIGSEPSKIDCCLSSQDFDTAVRLIKQTAGIEVVKQIETVTSEQLVSLGVRRNARKAVKGVPKGSDQVDVGSILSWVKKVDGRHSKSVEQLVAIDATAYVRIHG